MNENKRTPQAGQSHPLLALVMARLREFWREPAAIFWVYVFPLLMVAALGIAFRNPPSESFAVAIKEGPHAQDLKLALQADERFLCNILSEEECRKRLRTGRADLMVARTATEDGQYTFDPTKSTGVLARNAVNDCLQRSAGRTDVIAVKDQAITEPGNRYIDFLVPGLIGMGIMGGGLWGVGFAIVDLRIRKLLKRYLATPMRRGHFMGSVLISRLVFMVPEILVLLLFSQIFFQVTISGSFLLFATLVLLGSMQFSGIGLLVASRAQTLETISGLINFVMLPMWFASGIFFSSERFPEIVQPLIKILPLTPLINALRSVMLEGAGVAALSQELALILGWTVVTFFLGLRLFRWN